MHLKGVSISHRKAVSSSMEDIGECLHMTGRSLERPHAGTVSSKQRGSSTSDHNHWGRGCQTVALKAREGRWAAGPANATADGPRVCDTVSTQHSTAAGHTEAKPSA